MKVDVSRMFSFWVILVIFPMLISGQSCPNDCISSQHGKCQDDGTCLCGTGWSGEDCSDSWRNYYKGFYDFYKWGCFSIFFISALLCSWELLAKLVIYRTKPILEILKQLGTTVVILDLLALFFRLVIHGTDPITFELTIPVNAGSVIFELPIILWYCAYVVLLLFWVELRMSRKKTTSPSLTRTRPILLVIMFAFSCLTIPISIVKGVQIARAILSLVYNAILAIFFIVTTAGFTYFGFGFLKEVKKAGGVGGSQHKKKLIKITRVMIVCCFLVLFLIFLFILFAILDAPNNRSAYLPLHFIFRIVETCISIVILVIVAQHISLQSFRCSKSVETIQQTASSGTVPSSNGEDSVEPDIGMKASSKAAGSTTTDETDV